MPRSFRSTSVAETTAVAPRSSWVWSAAPAARPPRPVAQPLSENPKAARRAGGQRSRPHPDPAGYVAGLVNRLASDDAVFTVDVGSPVVWAARYLSMNAKRRLVGSFNHGTMACALPHAIGAQTAFRNRQVVALAGDGGLTMMFGELVTLLQNRLPVK